MPIDPNRLKAIFLEAADQPDEAARSAYLDRACGSDADLRERVEALLKSHNPADSFLGTPAAVVPDPNLAGTETFAAESDAGGSPSKIDEALSFLTPSARRDSLGRIGHYEVLQVLGQGGFGIVFRAFDEVLQRVVAIKVMTPQFAATSPARKRFLREARTSAAVRHENVVQVYEVAEQPLPYLAMEFIPGETLQQKLDRTGPLDVTDVLRIGRQIAEGLAAAHATDLIHRDIKPANILIDGPQQRVKITDFGLARAADDASISQSGIIAGTPMYMAPEQALGAKLDQRADLFSLGSVLYQMTSGRAPFRAAGTLAVLKRVAEDTPRPIREIIPETPQWLCDIISKLHAKNTDERYQSARDVADVLADCEGQLKAGSKLKDFSRIPRGKRQNTGRRMWVVFAAVIVLLPVIALIMSAFAGVYFLMPTGPTSASTDPGPITPFVRPAEIQEAQLPPFAIAPFSSEQARRHQEAWAKHLGVPVEFTDDFGHTFRLIPPGEFDMGTSEKEIEKLIATEMADAKAWDWAIPRLRSESPIRKVRIESAFYEAIHETTLRQFRAFVKATGYKTRAELDGGGFDSSGVNARSADAVWNGTKYATNEGAPAQFLVRDDSNAYCQWLSRQTKRDYAIPTEQQWEYACRAGTTTTWSFGNDVNDLRRFAWTASSDRHETKTVGMLASNPFGLYDVHGNVIEVTLDDSGAPYFRGGSFAEGPIFARSAMRTYIDDSLPYATMGFRIIIKGDLKTSSAVQTTPTPAPVLAKTPDTPSKPAAPTAVKVAMLIPRPGATIAAGTKRDTEALLDYYEASDMLNGKALVERGEIVLIDVPTEVKVEGQSSGNTFTYVRPTEGKHKGKFLIVRASKVTMPMK